jgi:hypothetical protein
VAFEITCGAGRTKDFTGSVLKDDGVTAYVLAASDKLRIKIGVGGAVPLLDLVSGTPTANGSQLTITNRGQAANPPTVPVAVAGTWNLHLAQGDTALINAGAYDMEIHVVDSTDTAPANSERLNVQPGVIHFLTEMLGSTG